MPSSTSIIECLQRLQLFSASDEEIQESAEDHVVRQEKNEAIRAPNVVCIGDDSAPIARAYALSNWLAAKQVKHSEVKAILRRFATGSGSPHCH